MIQSMDIAAIMKSEGLAGDAAISTILKRLNFRMKEFRDLLNYNDDFFAKLWIMNGIQLNADELYQFKEMAVVYVDQSLQPMYYTLPFI